MEDYLKINRSLWNSRTDLHIDSEFYNNDSFIKGRSSLNDFELEILPDLTDKTLLHLQCHFGQDTISLARMGAECTGIDLSDKAIEKANELAGITGVNARFLCSDVYVLPEQVKETFDLVYTTYGTIGWLPDIKKWAKVVSHFLKPGGQFIFVDFHPVVWMFDDDFKEVKYRYFNDAAIVEQEEGTYAEKEADIKATSVGWNHGMAEVIGSLIDEGLVINSVKEYDYSPYDCFRNTDEFEQGKFRIRGLGNKIPMVYSIVAEKK